MLDDGPTLSASFMSFLQDELLPSDHFSMDPGTLAAVTSLHPALLPRPDELTRKRFADAHGDSEGGSDDEGEGSLHCGRETKRGKAEGSSAARSKANREKARREKINERFAELATLIDPGKEPKTDKPTILGDAVKYLQQVRVENQQLKQLNKFLEERMAQFERERGHQLYQYSLLMQHGGMMPGLVPPGMAVPQTGSLPGPSGMPAQPMLHAAHAHAVAVAASVAAQGHSSLLQSATNGSSSGGPPHSYPAPYLDSTNMQHPGCSVSPVPSGNGANHHLSAHASNAAAMVVAAAAGNMSGAGGSLEAHLAGQGMMMQAPMGCMGGMPGFPGMPSTGMIGGPSFWGMPSQMHDSRQDSLLRPPAA